MKWIRAALVATVVASTAACTGGVAGTPVAELWDPCTIPSEALVAAGVDPTVIDSGEFTQPDNEWKYCSYHQDWFVLTNSATKHPFDDLVDNPRAENVRPFTIGPREGAIYSELMDTTDEGCHVAFPSGSGAFDLAIRRLGGPGMEGDLCAEATRVSMLIEPAIPR